jgi:ligand-binding sensor domain-containing protein
MRCSVRVLTVVLVSVAAAVLMSSLSQAGWKFFGSQDGLDGLSVEAIIESRDGSILVGTTRGGLYRYDGLMWRPGGPVLDAYAILEDRSGSLWVGTDVGLWHGNGADWHVYPMEGSFPGDYVHAIAEDRSGAVWFGTMGAGVSRYDGEDWEVFTIADGLGSNYIKTIFGDSRGDVWLGTSDRGVSRYNGTAWHTFTIADGLADDRVQAFVEDGLGNLWVGTAGGVSRYDGASWQTYTSADGLAGGYVSTMLRDETGAIWVCTLDGGVSRYDSSGWRAYTVSDGLPSACVTSALEDRRGNLWFSTVAGVSRYSRGRWRTYTTADGLGDNRVGSIVEDGSGNLWFEIADRGVSTYDGVTWRTYTTADGLGDDTALKVLEDRVGRLWFATCDGAACRDETVFRIYRSSDGLAGNYVEDLIEDHAGNLWFATRSGVSCYDGVSWTTYTVTDGLCCDLVHTIVEDARGTLWFGTAKGISCYDGASWRTYTSADGLAADDVSASVQDRFGNLWFGTWGGGASRYDGQAWTTYTPDDGLPSYYVNTIIESRDGSLWFGTSFGLGRYDGVTWTTYYKANGLAGDCVLAVHEDQSGDLWVGVDGGVSRCHGGIWGSYGVSDGIGSSVVMDIAEDRWGNLWFATWAGGITRYEPDRVPPQTVISPVVSPLSSNANQTISFAAGFRETDGVRFSHCFDGTSWSAWAPTDYWQATGLPDGEHVFMVRARDKIGNVDLTPAVCAFEIDASPPMPVITFPTAGQAVRGSLVIRGTAADSRFENYCVLLCSAGSASLDTLGESSSSVTQGEICGWNTLPLEDGDYELHLSVADSLGLTGVALVEVVVDNHAPWANETAPTMVSVTSGGDVYTTEGEVHLYFPPHAFGRETEVRITPVQREDMPDTLGTGAVRVLAGYEVSWGSAALEKPGTLEMSYAGSAALLTDTSSSLKGPLAEGVLALYTFGSDSTWRRLGGTVDGSTQVISSPLKEPGRYAVFEETAVASGSGTLSDLAVTPRVFSPRGNFASGDAAIGFTLGRPGPVTVKIYNRAGRLVREVASGRQMNAGANLVRWDGRDSAFNQVEDGLYLVVVEALGKKQTGTLAVVR